MNLAELHDVTPVPQDDGPEPVCSIAYAPEFVEAHDYLRAFLKADERSQRALDVTTACVKANPANYTVWHFRRRCLAALSAGSDGIDVERIERDLEFADSLGGTNPKNYQLWYHRRALLEHRFKGESEEKLQVAAKELDYVDKILGDDSKNYHAWSHRQWLIRTLDNPELWSSEIDFAHSKILSDPRNNSAWNQRWFALHEGKIASATAAAVGEGFIISVEKAEEETSYALSGAAVDPHNESPWRYLVGILMEQWRGAQRGGNADHEARAEELLRDCIAKIREMKQSWEEQPESSDSSVVVCTNLLSALVDLLEIFSAEKELLEEAVTHSGVLAVEDPVRRKYWRKREQKILTQLEKLARA